MTGASTNIVGPSIVTSIDRFLTRTASTNDDCLFIISSMAHLGLLLSRVGVSSRVIILLRGASSKEEIRLWVHH